MGDLLCILKFKTGTKGQSTLEAEWPISTAACWATLALFCVFSQLQMKKLALPFLPLCFFIPPATFSSFLFLFHITFLLWCSAELRFQALSLFFKRAVMGVQLRTFPRSICLWLQIITLEPSGAEECTV